MPRTFHIQTYGCQMNACDSDWLVRSLVSAGFREAPFEEASIYILNTCSVRDKAEQKVYSELGRIARHAKVHGRRGVTVCVGGCVAQQAGPGLIRRFSQVRLLFGADGIARAPEAIIRLVEEPGLRLSLLEFSESYEERLDPRLGPFLSLNSGAEPELFTPPGSAGPGAAVPPAVFVNIMQGCDNYCAYCIVPYVRGRQKSRAAGAVLSECRALLDGGAREITLLGQNVNSYGQDLARGVGFATLLAEVAALPGLERLRFVTPHPKDIAPEVIEAFASCEKLCPRLHLPLQSGSDRILKAMNRRYDTAGYLDIVDRLKKARPDIVFSTDIIVGFPGESEDDFEATMRMMREVGFAASFSFVYSDRPGARAALLPGKVERRIALERLSRLQEQQNQASEKVLSAMTGRTERVLIEACSRLELVSDENGLVPEPEERDGQKSWQGRTGQGFIVNVNLPGPELAAQAFLSSPAPEHSGARPGAERGDWTGALLPVRIESAARHSLKGSQAGEAW